MADVDEQPLPSPADGPTSSRPHGDGDSAASPAQSPGKALLIYSALRLGLLVVCFALLRVLLGADASPLLVIGGAVLMSALLSLVLLKRQRDAFAEASLARAGQRRADKQARRSRLDQGGASNERSTGA